MKVTLPVKSSILQLKTKILTTCLLVVGMSWAVPVVAQNVTIATGLPSSASSGSASAPMVITFCIDNTRSTPVTLKGIDNYMATGNASSTWKLLYSASSLSGQPNVTTWTVIDSVTGPTISTTGIYTLFTTLNFSIPATTVYRFALQNSTSTINYGGATTTPNNLTVAGINVYRGDYQISSANVGYAGAAAAPSFQPRFWCGSLYLDTLSGCTGTPNAPTITTTALSGPLCPGSTKSISASNPSPPAGIKYKWEQAASSSGPWTNVSTGTGDTTLNYTTAALSTTTWFRIKAICGTNTAASSGYQVPIAGTPTPGTIGGSSASVCIGSTLTYNVAAVSGATSYTWTLPSGWTGSSTTNSISAVAGSTGIISVTATGPCGPSAASNLAVTVNALPTISVTPAAALAICDGSGTPLTGNGGVSYAWSPSGSLSASTGTTVTASPSSTTTYTLTGTDANGCVNTATKTVTVNPLPTVSVTPFTSLAVCAGLSTNLTGNGALTYSWSPSGTLSSSSGTTVTATPTSTTTYTVTGTDGNGCMNTATKTVIFNPLPNISISPSGPTSVCGGVNPVLTANGALTYTWSPSGTLSSGTGSTVTASPGTGTTYTITGTDVNGCVNTTTKFVDVKPLPTISISPSATITICSGNGATLTGNGGASYSWSPSGSLSSGTGTTVTASPLTTTTYTVIGTDVNGCTNTATKTVNVNTSPSVSISPATAIAFCNGGSASLTANGALTYSWSPATGLSATTGGTVTASPTSTNTYVVTGTAANGCVGTATKLVTVFPLPPVSVSPGGTTTICSGLSTTLTANGALTYTWSPSGSLSASTGSVVIASPTTSTTYNITGTDINGCINSTTKTINVNNSPTVGINPATPPVMCFGASATLTGTGANTYTWSPAAGLSSTTGGTVTASPSVTTTYTVIGTDPNGCTGTATKTVTINQLPPVSISPTTAVSICSGASATLTANGALTYTWTPATGLSSTTGAVVSANPGASTTYTVTGTDANGCSNTANRLVTVLGLPTIGTSLGSNAPLCPGSSVSITANGAVTYVWSPSTSLSSGTGTTVIATPPVTTTYTVTGTAANGCVNSTTRTITVQPRPSSDITPAGYVTICQYDSVVLSATAGYANYKWMIYGVQIATAVKNTLTTSTGGYYTLQVLDSNGCTTTTSQPTIVIVVQRPVPIISVSGATLDAGAGYIGYQWYLGGVAIAGANARFYTPVLGGLYTVEVLSDPVHQCWGRSSTYQYTAVGVNTNAIAASIRLHPNPASDIVLIDAPIAVSITVTSVEGKIVYSERNAKELNIKEWADGVYQVVLRDQSGRFLKTEKLTKLGR